MVDEKNKILKCTWDILTKRMDRLMGTTIILRKFINLPDTD